MSTFEDYANLQSRDFLVWFHSPGTTRLYAFLHELKKDELEILSHNNLMTEEEIVKARQGKAKKDMIEFLIDYLDRLELQAQFSLTELNRTVQS